LAGEAHVAQAAHAIALRAAAEKLQRDGVRIDKGCNVEQSAQALLASAAEGGAQRCTDGVGVGVRTKLGSVLLGSNAPRVHVPRGSRKREGVAFKAVHELRCNRELARVLCGRQHLEGRSLAEVPDLDAVHVPQARLAAEEL
jgi:hypothetical protein